MVRFGRGRAVALSMWALLAAACGNETAGLDERDASDEDAPTSVASTPPETSTTPPVAPPAPTSVEWYTDEARAREVAKERGAPRLVVFGASWCAGCRVVERTFRTEEVKREVARFTALSLDITDDGDPKVIGLMRDYGVVGLPLVLVFDSEGAEVMRTQSLPEASEVARLLRGVR